MRKSPKRRWFRSGFIPRRKHHKTVVRVGKDNRRFKRYRQRFFKK